MPIYVRICPYISVKPRIYPTLGPLVPGSAPGRACSRIGGQTPVLWGSGKVISKYEIGRFGLIVRLGGPLQTRQRHVHPNLDGVTSLQRSRAYPHTSGARWGRARGVRRTRPHISVYTCINPYTPVCMYAYIRKPSYIHAACGARRTWSLPCMPIYIRT